jgi:hypothetical protein
VTTATRYTNSYYCTNCGLETPREQLTVKKAVFTDMGSKARMHKSRVVDQLCPRPTCLPADPDWQREAFEEPNFKVLPAHMRDEGEMVVVTSPRTLSGQASDPEEPPEEDENQPMLPGFENVG